MCRNWTPEGSPLGKKEYRGNNGNFANTASRDGDFKQTFAQQQKDMEIMKKMLLKQGKMNKRLKKRRKKDSSDEDSSNDDE